MHATIKLERYENALSIQILNPTLFLNQRISCAYAKNDIFRFCASLTRSKSTLYSPERSMTSFIVLLVSWQELGEFNCWTMERTRSIISFESREQLANKKTAALWPNDLKWCHHYNINLQYVSKACQLRLQKYIKAMLCNYVRFIVVYLVSYSKN